MILVYVGSDSVIFFLIIGGLIVVIYIDII